ncbi:MAG: 50S ribosomal protein L15, partial [Candidatus Kapaibacterium sp.]
RAGAKIGIAFEGGQMPLNRRLPKFGFYNPFRVEYQEVNIKRLQELADADKLEGGKVNFDVLLKLGVINHKSKPVKILGDGDISAPLTVEAHKFTNSAKEKIESAGGTVTING